MTWIDELRDEVRQRQGDGRPNSQTNTNGRGDEDAAYAGKLVRNLLEGLNRELLQGRGSVWESDVTWGLRLWELWWGQTRIEGQYIVVTLMRDSRGTPYLKLNRIRLALRDPNLERRLQRALRAAFLHPRTYTPRQNDTSRTQSGQQDS